MMDPFTILPQEKARYVEQFNALNPVSGFVSGDQAKGFLLQSQLPPMILGHIWELADLNADGKLDFTEFSIACKLINAKLRGFDIPKLLPPTLRASAAATLPVAGTPPSNLMGATPLIPSSMPAMPAMQMSVAPQPMMQPMMVQPMMQPMMVPSNLPLMGHASAVMPPVAASPVGIVSPSSGFPMQSKTSFDGSKPNTPDSAKTVIRAASVSSKDSPSVEWAVPHSSKLKYTQLFNTHDRGKTGFLTGVQARGILVQTQLPQPLLARVWALSDIDADGRLSCDEFVLAMHLCEVVRIGDKLPEVLPPELIPPTFRRPSLVAAVPPTGIITTTSEAILVGSMPTSPSSADELKMMSPTSFEDKRKENFDKGQAELDKRRRALADQQRREQEERERKEREEYERKEKIRIEQERRQQAELEKKLAKQREIEMEKEEQRRKMLEQREAARKEMERQRQLEWQKQRLQELLQQKQKEQEKVALLRANHQRLLTELNVLDDRVLDLSCRITDTRTGVAETKNTIDGMRTTRDTQMSQLNGLKTQLREQNQRLLTVSQEKARLEAKNRMNAATPNASDQPNAMQNIAARQLALNQSKEKFDLISEELNKKIQDAENNNSQLNTLKSEMTSLARLCQQSHQTYVKKREEVLLLRATGGKQKSWGNDAWAESSNSWPVSSATSSAAVDDTSKSGFTRYRALYEFVARNGDEISFQPGDIILVTESLSNEPGWLSGEVRGHVGWFPEAYVEKMDQSGWSDNSGTSAVGTVDPSVSGPKRHHLEGIQELPENVSDNGSIADAGLPVAAVPDPNNSAFMPVSGKIPEDASSPILGQGQIVDNLKAEAINAWQGKKENHLSFGKGDVILVREQQDLWWFGQCNGQSGWFPQSFVTLFQADNGPMGSLSKSTSLGREVDDGCYVAMYPYDSNEPGDLSFVAGEAIMVIKKEGDWWTGTIGLRSGVFPSNYVQKAESQYEADANSEVEGINNRAEQSAVAKSPASNSLNQSGSQKRSSTAPIDGDNDSSSISVPRPSSVSSASASPSNMGRGSKKPEIATVIAPYSATSSEQLSLQRGQLIMIRKKSASGWWEGELQAKGRNRERGWFPASYVKVLSSSGGGSSRTTPRTTPVPAEMEDDMPQMPPTEPTETEINSAFENSSSSSVDQVVALFPYTAQNEDELSFLQGDVLVVVDREDPAWWRGQLKGQVGLFPSNYVEVMGSLAASAALGAAANTGSATHWVSNGHSESNNQSVNLSSKEQTRQTVIQELISTEELYNADLKIVQEVFIKPMLQSTFTCGDVDTIFVNWKDLISCNNTLLRAFRIRKKMNPSSMLIGDILIDHFPHMSPYIRFCSRQLNAAALIQNRHENVPEFRALLKTCQANPLVKNLPLTSFLLKPMQRITKYPLLIKKILEATDTDHPDRLLLDEALHKAEELCTQVNEGVREQENSDRLEWLQKRVQIDGLDERIIFNSLTNVIGPRKLIHFGFLKKVKSSKDLLTFVFNDFVLFTTTNKPPASLNLQFLFDEKSNLTLRIYRKPIFLRDMLIVIGNGGHQSADSGGENETALVRFTIQDTNSKLLLTTGNASERITWLRKLEEARKHCLHIERMVLQRLRSKQNEGNVCGRLLVLVIEAENLQQASTVRQRPPLGKLRVVVVEGCSLTKAARNSKGKSDTFAEVMLGSQEHRTKTIANSLNPKWNASMQFLIKDLKSDVLCVTVFDRDNFSPNEFLGRTEVRIEDVLQDTKTYRGPLVKRLPLYEVESGQIVLKLDLQLFDRKR